MSLSQPAQCSAASRIPPRAALGLELPRSRHMSMAAVLPVGHAVCALETLARRLCFNCFGGQLPIM